MKRALLSILIVSLVAFPVFGASKQQVTTARCLSLEHVTGGWRMQINCDQGKGAIIVSDQNQYRGEGVFAAWSQEQMKDVYRSLIPKDESRLELIQLG